MKWKLWPLLILLGCCLASAQSTRRGLSLIAVPVESVAAELQFRIRSGSSFEALAMTYSTDPTGPRGGYMGMMDQPSLPLDFRSALKGLKPGAVSPITRAGDRFVLLKWATEEEDHWRAQNDDAIRALEEGRYPAAISLFLAAVRQAERFGLEDVRLAESLNGLAQVYRYQQNYSEAEPPARRSLAILERAAGPSSKAVLPSLVNLAGVARSTGRHVEAEQLYRRLLSVRWGTPDATEVSASQVLDNLAEVLNLAYARDPRLAKALDEYWRSISGSKLDKELFPRMRDLLLAVPLLPEAESLMQRAARMSPDSRQLQFQLSEVLVTRGKYEEALDALENAVRLAGPSNPLAERAQRSLIYATIAQMNFYLVRFDDAFAALKTALEANPDSVSSRLLLGALYFRRNQFSDAAAEYQRVISANPSDADAHDGLAQVELARGRYAEAVRDADKALEFHPGLQSSLYVKAMALIRDGRDREGRAVLEEYEHHEADRKTDESRLSEIQEIDLKSSDLLARQRPQEAAELLREGIRSHPFNAVLYRKLGLTDSAMGLHREAAEVFETMVKLKPDDFLGHLQLSREYEALGNGQGAREQRVIYLQKYDAALQTKAN